MFCDLCLPEHEDLYVQRDRLAMALRLGFGVVATEHLAKGRLAPQDRCHIQPLSLEAILAGASGEQAALVRKSLGFRACAAEDFQQLKRLTLSTDDPAAAAQAFAGGASDRSETAGYDLLAVQPLSERLLQQVVHGLVEAHAAMYRVPTVWALMLLQTQARLWAGQGPVIVCHCIFTGCRNPAKACSSLQVQIISLDLAQRLPFRLKPKVLAPALERGVMFEICYACCLRDETSRRMLFSNAAALARATRGKNIIISSGARTAFELRSPYDAINLSTLFGLPTGQAKNAISSHCQPLLEAARLRDFHKGAIRIDTVDTSRQPREPPEQEQADVPRGDRKDGDGTRVSSKHKAGSMLGLAQSPGISKQPKKKKKKKKRTKTPSGL